MTDPTLVRSLVEAATKAPSVHNTQPWRFVVDGDTVQLRADRSRWLPVLDPRGRAAHLSCGAALFFARVDAAARAVPTVQRRLPDPRDPDHLADLVLGRGKVEDALNGLREAIDARHTDRTAYEDKPVPKDAIRSLADAAQAEGCWLRVVGTDDDAAAVTVLLARADDAQSADPAYREELALWSGRPNDSPDGIPASAVPSGPPQERGSNYRLRDFDADREANQPRWSGEPPRPEHPVVVVLGTTDDDPTAWLRAGEALGRLLLTATATGLSASPMTQAMEVEDTRARLVQELGLVGHAQMVLRLGYPSQPEVSTTAPQPTGRSLRRPVDQILEMH